MKIILLFLICGAVFALYFFSVKRPFSSSQTTPSSQNTKITNPPIQGKERMSIFVPYWTVSEDSVVNHFERYIYFGIAANENGIDYDDSGYKKLPGFKSFSKGKESYLTLRMVDMDINKKILSDKTLQKKIIRETISLAKQNQFSGIVLDLETPSLAFESVTKSISNFIADFYQEVKSADMPFAIILYGDTYYRARPYDVKFIGEHADEILIMAYDFHKARGNPGPNFPLSGKEVYGYDFKTMISDFEKDVPKEKLTVIFGMFGYDWKVDDQQRSIRMGEPFTLSESFGLFSMTNCGTVSCVMKRDTLSSEEMVLYSEEGIDKKKDHIAWYEDATSVKQKYAHLKKEVGIQSVAFWAYSYFNDTEFSIKDLQ